MTKPDDIPQDVWNEAYGQALLFVQWLVPAPTDYVQAEHVLAVSFARAILAAKAEERGDIWAIASGNAAGERELERLAMEAGDAEDCLLHALLARENDQIASAIRKRGEAN